MKNKIIILCVITFLFLISNTIVVNSSELTSNNVETDCFVNSELEIDTPHVNDNNHFEPCSASEDSNIDIIDIEVVETPDENTTVDVVNLVTQEDNTEEELCYEITTELNSEDESQKSESDEVTGEDETASEIYTDIEENDGFLSTLSSENEISSDIYDTAPEISEISLRTTDSESSGFRFVATVTYEQKSAALEYGILICETAELDNGDTELTLDNNEISYTKSVAYDRDGEIDNVYYADDESVLYAGFTSSIYPENYVSYITARPYIIYDVNNTAVYVYGNIQTTSIYRSAKNMLNNSNTSQESLEIVKGYILAAENLVSLTTAVDVDLSAEIERTIGANPDIDIVKFTPEKSKIHTISFSSEDTVTYEILDEHGFNLTSIETTVGSAFLFEKNQTYYIRLKGVANTYYSIIATPCMENAIIYDFADNIEGFTFGNGATGTVEDGVLNISIDKHVSLTKTYAQNNNLSIDLFDYSRLIIRMKNTTRTTAFEGTVRIDLEYDGNPISYTLESSMPSNMTEFENIEFDFTTRYGAVSSLKLSFGELLSSLSGNIYIDSIAILPMPEVLNWDFDESLEDWSYNAQVGSATVSDGVLALDMLGSVTGMAPAIMSPETSAYDYDKYNEIKIRLKNTSSATNMQVYYCTLAQSSYSEDKKAVIELEPNSSEFIEYTINLTEQAAFTDSLKGIMISIPVEGTVEVDYIRLLKKYIPPVEYNDVVWDFVEDLDGFISNNERHTLSAANGNMKVVTIEKNDGGFFSPNEAELPVSEYRYLVIGVNSASKAATLQTYFKTSDMTTYEENDTTNKVVYKHILDIEESTTFKEYVIDLSYAGEGWTTGYTGHLQQFMFAIATPGEFVFDYFKLTSGDLKNSIEINATTGSTYQLLITKNNTLIPHGTYTIEYDSNIFELIDACAFTYAREISEGQAAGTDIRITSLNDGSITFSVDNTTVGGVINCIKLLAINSNTSSINVTAICG